MKKKWKIMLSILVALVLGVGVYAAYIFKFKEYDVADEAVDEIVENPYEVELPDGSKLVIGEDGSVTTQPEGEGDSTSKTDKENGTTQNGSSTLAGATPVGKTETMPSAGGSTDAENESTSGKGDTSETESQKPTVADVKAKYEPVFKQLEGQADSKINSLIGRAKKEYSDKKANGESISYGYFYNKYMGAANTLEANTDSVFYGVVQAVEAELAANGYSKSHAKSFVEHYEATKKARRDGILKKVAGRS